METLEKKEQLNTLFDMYHTLLTDKQVLYFNYYYREDYSLQEISELVGVSRNAIYDQLKKVEQHLFLYEEKLELLKKRNQRLSLIDQLDQNQEMIKALRKLDE